ncbi:hypothetical protein MAR_022939 [Mya arenaria]|uniref:Uncharacterized protein n=1 Tax=Mya arenaria TaxID=6604 RepID=A0ABY7DLI1_MYAAR|nr:hypothetical protein MAR_022939 [Mya arenaria]
MERDFMTICEVKVFDQGMDILGTGVSMKIIVMVTTIWQQDSVQYVKQDGRERPVSNVVATVTLVQDAVNFVETASVTISIVITLMDIA